MSDFLDWNVRHVMMYFSLVFWYWLLRGKSWLLRRQKDTWKCVLIIFVFCCIFPLSFALMDEWIIFHILQKKRRGRICDVLFPAALVEAYSRTQYMDPSITCFTILSLHCCLIQDQQASWLSKLRKPPLRPLRPTKEYFCGEKHKAF